jgi:hypothetical protein
MGITLLQMSKVDPTTLKLDRRSTILLQATKRPTELQEKSISGFEEYVPFLASINLTLFDFSTIVDRFVSSSHADHSHNSPGMDALRGGFGTVGSIIRARSMRKSIISGTGPASPVEQWRQRHPYANSTAEEPPRDSTIFMQRHQLYDKPVPGRAQSSLSLGTQESGDDISLKSQTPKRGHKSIKFGDQDTRHFYPQPGTPGEARHDWVIKGDPSARDSARDSYASTPDTTAGGSSRFAGEQPTPKSQKAIRPLPNPKVAFDPFEDARFRGGSGGSAAELDRGADSASEDSHNMRRDEEVPLTASLHKGYPSSGHADDDREESFGLVGQAPDSVRLVQPRNR